MDRVDTAIQGAYRVRTATTADVPLLTEIERRAAVRFEPFGLHDAFAAVVTPTEALESGALAGRLWVATQSNDPGDDSDRGDDEIVGFALAGTLGTNAHLKELDVLPEHGRRGIGATLLHTFLQWARLRGYAGATLTTLRGIPWNAPFYEQHGFRVLSPHDLSPELAALLGSEGAAGSDDGLRVVMYRPIP